ncbi:MAG: HAD-IIIA family hydrolase [Candidatus Hermodarchaeota archaeon]
MNKKIILIIGYPAAGKTEAAKKYIEQGYHRLNRDEIGGKLDDLVDHLEDLYKNKRATKFVMDNTYSTLKSRKSVIRWARDNNFEIECHWIDLDVGDALYNAVQRMINAYGRMLTPDQIKESNDIGVYPPVVIYEIRKSFEAPNVEEGFNKVVKIKFKRELDNSVYINRAIILDYDGTLRKTKSGEKYPKSPDDIELLPNRTETLKKFQNQGYLLLGASNQSFVSKKVMTEQQAIDCFETTNDLLDLEIDYKFCPHPSYPQICYCRKPMPGMAVEFIEKYKLNPSNCIVVGDSKTDKTFAKRCGFQYSKPEDFFNET